MCGSTQSGFFRSTPEGQPCKLITRRLSAAIDVRDAPLEVEGRSQALEFVCGAP